MVTCQEYMEKSETAAKIESLAKLAAPVKMQLVAQKLAATNAATLQKIKTVCAIWEACIRKMPWSEWLADEQLSIDSLVDSWHEMNEWMNEWMNERMSEWMNE